MRASIHYVNGREAALVKLGYYDRGYDPYGGLSDNIYQHGHAMRDQQRLEREDKDRRARTRAFAGKAMRDQQRLEMEDKDHRARAFAGKAMRDQQRLEMEDKDHRARAFAGKAMRNPGELEALQQKLTQNEIDESRAAHGVAGGLLGGSLGALGGSALGAAIRPHGPASALGMLGGAALGGYGGYRLMEPMGQEAGQASADEILDLAHTHGLAVGKTMARGTAMGAEHSGAPNGVSSPTPDLTAKSAMWDISPEQLTMMGRHTAAGTLGGSVAGGLMAGEGHRGEGALRGGLTGGSAIGVGSLLGNLGGNALAKHMLRDMDPAAVAEARKQVEQQMLDQSTPISGLAGLSGLGLGTAEGAGINPANQDKLAFTKSTHKGLLP